MTVTTSKHLLCSEPLASGKCVFLKSMKLLRTAALLLSIVLGSTLSAQKKQEFAIDLNHKCWLRSHAYSSTLALHDSLEYGFLGLSAFTLDTVNAIQLEFRSRQNGEWTSWQAMRPPHEGRAIGRQAFAADPIMEKIDALEFRSTDSLDKPLTVRLFLAPTPEKKSPEVAVAPNFHSNESCTCPKPAICERLCWCPDSSCTPPAYTNTSPTHIIVHHSAGFTNYNDYKWVVSYYWDLHVNTNGWSDIGYNWLVDPNGVIYEGRGQGHLGAHFSCLNGETVGICLIGNYMNNQPQNAGLASLENLIIWESCTHGIDPADSSVHASSQLLLKHISGHRDANSATVGCPSGTVCPGDMLYPKLDSLARTAAQRPCVLHQAEWHLSRVSVFPNPVKSFLQVEGAKPGSPYQIFSFNGQVVLNGQLENEGAINVSALPPGQYLLRLPESEASVQFNVAK